MRTIDQAFIKTIDWQLSAEYLAGLHQLGHKFFVIIRLLQFS